MAHFPEPSTDAFIELLRRLRWEVGNPPVSALVEASRDPSGEARSEGTAADRLAGSTIYDVLANKRRKPPRWKFVARFLWACQRLAAERGMDPEALGGQPLWSDLHRRAMNGSLVSAGLDVPAYLRDALPEDLTDIRRESLILGPRTGDVYTLVNHPGRLYREYRLERPDGAALSELIHFPGTLSAQARDVVVGATAWPSARVLHDGSVTGVLIPVTPREFTVVGEGRRSPQDLSYLVNKPRPAWSRLGLRLPHVMDRIELVQEFARLLHALHEGGVVVGEIHDEAILWSLGTGPRILLLGCDGVRAPSGALSLPRKPRPGWEAPGGEDADRYKLAMLVGRVLTAEPRVRPGDELVLPEDVPAPLAEQVKACFAAAGSATEADRPDAARWEEALSGAARTPGAEEGPDPGSRWTRAVSPRPSAPDPRDVLPFYLVCDESSAMSEQAGWFLGEVLAQLRGRAAADPVAAEHVRFGVVAFNHRTEVLLDLDRVRSTGDAPKLRGLREVDLGQVFVALRDVISDDMRRLDGQGLMPYRPTVFLLMAAEPAGDGWSAAYGRLTDPSSPTRPAVVSIGLSGVSRHVVESTGSAGAFVAADGDGDRKALRWMGDFLARSMLESARQLGASTHRDGFLLVPESAPGLHVLTGPKVPGYTTVPLERALSRKTSRPGRVLPLYLVCEESEAMAGGPIETLNRALPDLVQEIGSTPAVADVARLCLIGFDEFATVLLSPTALADLESVPAFQATGKTKFGPVFQLLGRQIGEDVERFRAAGNDVHRPAVIFVTCGEPDDNWAAEYEALTGPGNPFRPNILAMGLGEVSGETLARIASMRAFVLNSMSLSLAVRELAFSLTRSIVAHGAGTSDARGLVGFTVIPADSV